VTEKTGIKNGFSDPTKEQVGQIDKEKLSEMAVMKRMGSDECVFKREEQHQKELSESNH